MEVNSVNTQLDDELLKDLDKELRTELFDFIDSVKFIRNLISPNRPKLSSLEKEEDGRIKVDITNPHILEDMDYFRQPAVHYKEHGTYTLLHPNAAPSSEYFKYWKEEARRCREGLVREDGEWIPGNFYFYLNYSPILVTKVKRGSKRADRVQGFPSFYDGDYWFFHYMHRAKEAGKHSMVLKRRGSGFSYKSASQLSRLFILGDTEIAKEEVSAFAIANEKEYLIKDGILNKFVDISDWNSKNTPWPRIRDLRNSLHDMQWKMGYKDRYTGTEEGTGNEIIGVTLMNDPERARGKRGTYIFWEESGKFDQILKAWEIAKPSVEEAGWAYGHMCAFGTGGADVSSFRGAEEFFYNPRGYNIYSVPNVYDKNVGGSTMSAFFFGAYLNRLGCFDENGNSNVIQSLIEILAERLEVKYGASDPNTLVQKKAENPIVPQEAVMRKEGSLFPVMDLKDYLADISPNLTKFLQPHYMGRLKVEINGKIEWSNEQVHPVLRSYPVQKDELDKYGCVEIYEMPRKNNEDNVPRGRYIAGIDPIDYDSPFGTGSLGSMFVFDLWVDRIVAEYTGRPPTANEFYETCLRLLKFYNAEGNYENNLKGLFAYFDNNNSLYYLCDTPQILRDMEYIKGVAFGNKAKDTAVNKGINVWGRKLQADWMVGQAYEASGEEEMDKEGNVIKVVPKMNLQKLRTLGYIREAISWNPDDNFDRVSAMTMVMVLREDRLKYEKQRQEGRVKTINDDPWFNRYGGFNRRKVTPKELAIKTKAVMKKYY